MEGANRVHKGMLWSWEALQSRARVAYELGFAKQNVCDLLG